MYPAHSHCHLKIVISNGGYDACSDGHPSGCRVQQDAQTRPSRVLPLNAISKHCRVKTRIPEILRHLSGLDQVRRLQPCNGMTKKLGQQFSAECFCRNCRNSGYWLQINPCTL